MSSNREIISVKCFTGSEIVPFSSVYDDRAVIELGLLPSYIYDLIKTTLPRYVHGFEILNHDVVNTTFRIEISPGCCILNKSIAFIKNNVVLFLNVDQNWLDLDGYVVVDLSYSRSEKVYSMSAFFVDYNGNIYPGNTPFDVDDDHVIIALVKLEAVNQDIASVDLTKRRIRYPIKIKTKTFYVYGYYPISYDSGFSAGGDIEIIPTHFIEPIKIDEDILLSLVNTNDIPVIFNPQNYSPSDNRIVSHLSAIDSVLGSGQSVSSDLIVENIIITQEIKDNNMIITTQYNIDYSRFNNSVMIVHNGISMIPVDDYVYVSSNRVRIINPDVDVGDVVTFWYYREGE